MGSASAMTDCVSFTKNKEGRRRRVVPTPSGGSFFCAAEDFCCWLYCEEKLPLSLYLAHPFLLTMILDLPSGLSAF